MIVISTVRVRVALETAPSVAAAAKTLGISRAYMRSLAYKYGFSSIFAACAERGKVLQAPKHHPGFLDLTGKKIAGVDVIRQAEGVDGNARWRCRYACGHETIYPGIRLRAVEKKGTVVRCKLCDPKARREPKEES